MRKARPARQPRNRYTRANSYARANPIVETPSLEDLKSETGPGVLFIPVNQTEVRWAASSYSYFDQAAEFDRHCTEFFLRRVKYVTGKESPLDILTLSDMEIAAIFTHFEGPNYQQPFVTALGSIDLGDLTSIQNTLNGFEWAGTEEEKQEIIEQAALYRLVKTTLGARFELAALLNAEGKYPDYGVLGSTLRFLSIVADGQALTMPMIRQKVKELGQKLVDVDKNVASTATVVRLGALENTSIMVYLIATGPTDDDNLSLSPLRASAGKLQIATHRGILTAILENGLLDLDTQALNDGAKIYFALPKAELTPEGKDPSGSTELVRYLTSYRWQYRFNPESTRTNPDVANLVVGPGEEGAVLSMYALRPFRAADPAIELEVATRIAKQLLTTKESTDPRILGAIVNTILLGGLKTDEFLQGIEPYANDFGSVQHAYQTLKSGAFDAEAYRAGSTQVGKPGQIKKGRPETFTRNQIDLLRQLVYRSLDDKANKAVREFLSSTGERRIVVKPSKTGEEFKNEPIKLILERILEEYRQDLREVDVDSALGKLPDYKFTGSLTLTFKDKPTKKKEGFVAELGWVNRTDGRYKESNAQVVASWNGLRWEIVGNTLVSGSFREYNKGYFAQLVIDGLGQVTGWFGSDQTTPSFLAPSDEFLQELISLVRPEDVRTLLLSREAWRQKYTAVQENITRLAPFSQRTSVFSRLWDKERQENEQAARLQVEPPVGTYELLPNPRARRNSAAALQFWTVLGQFPELGQNIKTDIIITPRAQTIEGKTYRFAYGQKTLFTEATSELKKKIEYLPYILARTSSDGLYLYNATLEDNLVRLELQPKEELWKRLYFASTYAAQAATEEQKYKRFTQDELENVGLIRNLLANIPVSFVGSGSLVGPEGLARLMTWSQWRGSPDYIRTVGYIRSQKRRLFMPPGVQTMTTKEDVSLAERISRLTRDLSPKYKSTAVVDLYLKKVSLHSESPWSLLRLLTNGTWDFENKEYNFTVPSFSDNRPKLKRLAERLQVSELERLAPPQAAKEIVELNLISPSTLAPLSASPSKKVLVEQDMIPFEDFESIVFTIYAPIDPETTVKAAPERFKVKMKEVLAAREHQFKVDQAKAVEGWSPSNFQFRVPWLREPYTGMLEDIRRENKFAGLSRQELMALIDPETAKRIITPDPDLMSLFNTWMEDQERKFAEEQAQDDKAVKGLNFEELESIVVDYDDSRSVSNVVKSLMANRYRINDVIYRIQVFVRNKEKLFLFAPEKTPLSNKSIAQLQVLADNIPFDQLVGRRPEFLDDIIPPGVFKPALTYGMYYQVEMSKEVIQQQIQRYKKNYIPEVKSDFQMTSSEFERIASGQQTMLVREPSYSYREGQIYLLPHPRTNEWLMVRSRGSHNIAAVIEQEMAEAREKNVDNLRTYAEREIIRSFGSTARSLQDLVRSPLGQENQAAIGNWIFTNSIMAVFDVLYLGPVENIERYPFEERLVEFKDVGVPLARFSPILAIRRYLAEQANIIAADLVNGKLPSDEYIANTLSGILASRVAMHPKRSAARSAATLQAPLSILWAGVAPVRSARNVQHPLSTLKDRPDLGLYVGQMDIPSMPYEPTTPDPVELQKVYATTRISNGLRPVLMEPERVMFVTRYVMGVTAAFEIPRERKLVEGKLVKYHKPKDDYEAQLIALQKYRQSKSYRAPQLKPVPVYFPFYIQNVTCSTRKTLWQFVEGDGRNKPLYGYIALDKWLPQIPPLTLTEEMRRSGDYEREIARYQQPVPLVASFAANRVAGIELGQKGTLFVVPPEIKKLEGIQTPFLQQAYIGAQLPKITIYAGPQVLAPSFVYEYLDGEGKRARMTLGEVMQKNEIVLSRQHQAVIDQTGKPLQVKNNSPCTVLGFTEAEVKVSVTKDRKVYIGWVSRELFKSSRVPYGRNCTLTREEREDKKFLARLAESLSIMQDSDAYRDYEDQLTIYENMHPGIIRLKNQPSQHIFSELKNYIILSKIVEDRCYWNAITNLVSSDRNFSVQMASKGFLNSIASWQFKYYPELRKDLSWELPNEMLALLEVLPPIALTPEHEEIIYNGTVDQPASIYFSREDAARAKVQIGVEHVVIILGKVFRGMASLLSDDQTIQVSFIPDDADTVRTGSPVLDLLARKGYTISNTVDPSQLYLALTEVQAQLNQQYHHLEAGKQFLDFKKRLKRDEDMGNTIADQFLSALAKANPGLRGLSNTVAQTNPRRNPLTDDQQKALVDFTKAYDPKKPISSNIQSAARTALQGADATYRQETRVLTPTKLKTYFPSEVVQRDGTKIMDPDGTPIKWETEKRLAQGKLANQDLIQRTFHATGRDEIADPFVDRAKTKGALESELPLSAEDTARILEAQRKKPEQRRKATIPASAGLCKTYRTKRLDYELPTNLAKDMKKHVLIWLSPKDDSEVRVLQYRKGDHVDCDLSGSYLEEDLTSLLSRALQSNLYWLTEKPERARKIEIWIGRVGTTKIYCAYKPDEELQENRKKEVKISLDAVIEQLEKALTPGNTEFTATFIGDASADKKAWDEAVAKISDRTKSKKLKKASETTSATAETIYYGPKDTPYTETALNNINLAELRILKKDWNAIQTDENKKIRKDTKAQIIEEIKKLFPTSPSGTRPNPRMNPRRASRYVQVKR